MIEYRILEASGVTELERKVNDHIESGWSPHGGLCSAATHNNYFQAMTREKKQVKSRKAPDWNK
jgi:hypothetical protein